MHAPPFVPQEAPVGFAPASQTCPRKNVGETERLASMAGGAVLLLNGLFGPRRSRPLSFLTGAGLVYRGFTGRCRVYEALGISTASRSTREDLMDSPVAVPAMQGVKVEKSIAIQRSPAELFQFWKNLDNLPRVMRHLASVRETGNGTSHWVAYGPFQKKVEWDAEIYTEGENEFIAWRSLPGGDVDTAGSVHFRPLGDNRGTSVDVSLKYNPPGGKVAARIASLLGQGVEVEIEEDLRRFKALMEAGETPSVEGQPRGQRPSSQIHTEGISE
jgi:uncharacterized membrane protein